MLVLLWDFSNLDLRLAAWSGTTAGFALRDHWLLTTVLHSGARALTFVLMLLLLVSIWRPVGVLRQLPRARRVWLLCTVVSAMLLVSLIKHFSTTSCPWELQPFGGTAQYLSHWALGQPDGGTGHCFPGGHASGAFAWVAGFFAFRPQHNRIARTWLTAALVAGLVLGLSQQLRGGHFASHTLWTAWLCWAWAWLWSALLSGQAHGRPGGGKPLLPIPPVAAAHAPLA